jgi:DNA-binding Lrp family transcriptional regulator
MEMSPRGLRGGKASGTEPFVHWEDIDMTVMSLDRIDIKILNELQQNASLTNVELAARVNLSPSPCLARVRHLEKVGVIDRRIAVLDPSVLGLSVTAFIHIKLEKQTQLSLDNFTRSIDRISQVMECYLMTGESDYLLRVLVPNIEDLEDLIVNKLSRIQGVSSIKSSLALKRISQKTMLPIDTSRPVQIKPCQTATRHGERTAKPRCETAIVTAEPDTSPMIGLPRADALANFSAS